MADNKRKTKVVNPQYQYRQALTAVLVGIIVINLFILVGSLAPEVLGKVFKQHDFGYYLIGIAEIVIIIIFWRRTISTTHRVAGPMYAIDREFKKLRDGDLTFRIKLRPTDQFQDAAESINESIEQLCKEVSRVKSIAQALEHDPSPDNVTRLGEALNSFKTEETEPTDSNNDGRG